MPGDSIDGRRVIGLVVAGIGPIVTAIALVPLRDDIDSANLALILVVAVVLAAIVGDRSAAALAAVSATMSFDFFLVRPYLSMRIDSQDDIETVLVLIAVGLIVGEVAQRGRRSRRREERTTAAIARLHRVTDAVAHGTDLETVARAVIRELVALLRLEDCWLEFAPFQWPMPRLERAGNIGASEHHWFSHGYALPQDGVELPVLVRGREAARLVLLADPGVSVSVEERIIAVALADQLGSVIAATGPRDVERLGKELHAS